MRGTESTLGAVDSSFGSRGTSYVALTCRPRLQDSLLVKATGSTETSGVQDNEVEVQGCRAVGILLWAFV